MAEKALEVVIEFNRWNPLPTRPKKKLICPVESSQSYDVIIAHVDAGVFCDGFVTYGCSLRNHNREFVLAASCKEFISIDPALAEMLAIRWCLSLARNLQIQKIIIHSDCTTVVDCVNGVKKSVVLDPITEDCRLISKSFFVCLYNVC